MIETPNKPKGKWDGDGECQFNRSFPELQQHEEQINQENGM